MHSTPDTNMFGQLVSDIELVGLEAFYQLAATKATCNFLVFKEEHLQRQLATRMQELNFIRSSDYLQFLSENYSEFEVLVQRLTSLNTPQTTPDHSRSNNTNHLRQQVRQQQKFIDASLDVICAFDLEGKFIRVSHACEEVWGYLPEELLGQKYMDLVFAEDRDLTIQAASDIMSGITKTNFQNRYTRKDGSLVPIVWSARWDTEENIMYCVARDATEKLKAEQDLRLSEEKYRYLFMHSPLPMFIIDTDTFAFIEVNDAAVTKYGYSREEFLQLDVTQIRPPEDIPSFLDFTLSNRDNDQANHSLVRHRKKNGTTIYVEIYSHLLQYGGKRCRLALSNDITDKVIAEQALLKGNAEKTTILESITDGFLTVDKDWKVTYWNQEASRLLTKSKEHMIGKNLWKEFPEATSLNFYRQYQKAVREQMAVHFQDYFPPLQLWVSVSAYPSDQGLSVYFKDITESKKYEAEREVLIKDLIQNNADLKQFSYITSHNLRAPLSNLVGIVNLLETNTIPDERSRQLVDMFKASTVQLNNTVNDLLEILVIRNNIGVPKENVSIAAAFKKVVNSVAGLLQEVGGSYTTNFAQGDTVYFNSSYLHSILLNLLTNSIRYRSPERVLAIQVETRKINNMLHLSFTDNGLGIDLNRYGDRLFGLYQRFHDHPDSKGLGLYIANSQMRAMGGAILVSSTVNVGTTFTLQFNRVNDHD